MTGRIALASPVLSRPIVERLRDLIGDVAYALRLIRRGPSYSLVVIAVLAAGIAVNLIAFGLFKAVALAPLAGVRNSGSLVFAGSRLTGGQITPISYPDYQDLQRRAYPGLAAWAIQPLILTHGGASRLLLAELVTGNYFDVLGVTPRAGRTLRASDAAAPGQQPVVVLSDGEWRRSFGADPAVIGTTVRINGQPMTVVGVTSPDFRGAIVGVDTGVFVPVTMQPRLAGRNWLEQRDNRWIQAFLRPPAGISRARLEAQAAAMSRQLAAEHPNQFVRDRVALVSIWQWPYGAQTYMLPAVGVIGAMAALLLVVVCANVASLVLVRSTARRGETAARLTLGATRGRLVRQLMIESLALAVPGALLGFLLPSLLEPVLGAAAANVPIPLFFNAGPDRWLVAFTLLVGLLSAVLYGLVPAIRLSRLDLGGVLKDDLSPRGSTRSRLRTSLVVAQVAVALVLLVGTALALRTLEAAQRADPGFDPGSVTWATFDARAGGHDEVTGRDYYRRLLAAARAESGVSAASLATFLPLNFVDMMGWSVEPEGYQARQDEDLSMAVNVVTSDYFTTMGIPIVAGREFAERDEGAVEPPLIVNETFASRYFGSTAAAVGRRARINAQQVVIVGVARDAKYARLDEQPRPYVYAPFAHFYMTSMTLQLRSAADPAAVIARVREHARTLDPSMAVLDSGVMADQLRSATSIYETVARVLSIVGVLAAALSALGVYGLVAFTVSQSTHEIGIRAALGATRAMILRRFVNRGLVLAIAGLIVGLGASLAMTRLARTLLFGVESSDPVSFAGAALLVLAAALFASFVPAWRASRVDPVVALRRQ